MSMRQLFACLALLPLLNACVTTTRSVLTDELVSSLRAGPYEERTVIQTRDGQRVRLDPSTELRFLRGDGQLTVWVRASDVRTSANGLWVRREVPLRTASKALVHNLSRESIAILQSCAPEGATATELESGAVKLQGGDLQAWLEAFLHRAAEEQTRSASAKQTPEWRQEQGLLDLRVKDQWGSLLGIWSFYVEPYGWQPEIPGIYSLAFTSGNHGYVRLPELSIDDGLRFSEIRAAHLRNISGPRVLGTVAAAAVIVPSSVLFGHIGGHLSTAVANAALPPDLLSSSPSTDVRLWQPKTPLPDINVQPLFTAEARRRRIVRFVPKGEVGAELHAITRGLGAGALFSFRLFDIFEFGAGARYLYTRLSGPNGPFSHSTVIGVVNHSAHIDLDLRRRVAVVLGLDLGGGGGIEFMTRFQFGVRIRYARVLFSGLYPFNPTYLSFTTEPLANQASGWSFPTSLEFGAAF